MSPAGEQEQIAICQQYGCEFVPCKPESKLGVAIHTLGQWPLNGLRHPPTSETNGWFIWAGEWSSSPDFFAPLHTAHLSERVPEVIKFLGLPPGFRFFLAHDTVDVWFDELLLNI